MHYYRFTSCGLIRVAGKDARRYLNARLTCNVKDAPLGAVIKGGQLTAQGKCQGTFSVLLNEENSFTIISAYAPTESVLPALRQFIVADRVDTTDVSAEYAFFHVTGADAMQDYFKEQLPGQHIVQHPDGTIGWKENRGFEEGRDILVPVQQLSDFDKFLSANAAISLSYDEMLIRRAMAHTPEYPIDIDQANIFSESSLSAYISFSKGCYVGQEVIERIDAMGKTAWKIVSYRSFVKLAPKTALDNQLGSIINCSDGSVEGAYWGFARVKNNPEQVHKKMQVSGTEIVIDI